MNAISGLKAPKGKPAETQVQRPSTSAVYAQLKSRDRQLQIQVEQRITETQLYELLFDMQQQFPDFLYVTPLSFVSSDSLLKIDVQYELSSEEVCAFTKLLSESQARMKKKYERSIQKTPRELAKIIYEELVLSMHRKTAEETESSQKSVESFLYSSKSSKVCATLLHTFLKQFGLNSKLLKLQYNRNYVHYAVVLVLSEGESFLLDPTFEFVIDNEVWFRYFLLNRAQIVELRKREYEQLDLSLLSSHMRADSFMGLEVFSFTDYPLVAEKITTTDRDRTFVRLPKSMMENMPEVLKQLKLCLVQKTQQCGRLYQIQRSCWLEDLLLITFSIEKAYFTHVSRLAAALEGMVGNISSEATSVLKAVVCGVQNKNQLNEAVCEFTKNVGRPAEFSFYTVESFFVVDVVVKMKLYGPNDPVIILLNKDALRYHYSRQEARIQKIIDRMIEQLTRLHRTVYFSKSDQFREQDISRCNDVIRMDYPELWFVICQKYYQLDGFVTQAELFKLSDAEILRGQQQLWDEIDTYCTQERIRLPVIQREYFVSSVLRHTVVYDKSISAEENTAFGALVTKRSVCQGFSCAFKLLCDAFQVPCITIFGLGRDAAHCWNQICIYGQWYNVDPTWNQDAHLLQCWFNVDDIHFLNSHRYIDYHGFACTSMEHNLHQLKGCRISCNSASEMAASFIAILKALLSGVTPQHLGQSAAGANDPLPAKNPMERCIWFDTPVPVDQFYRHHGQKSVLAASHELKYLIQLKAVLFVQDRFLKFEFDSENMGPIETDLTEPLRTDCQYLIETRAPFAQTLDKINYKSVKYRTYDGYVLAQFQ